MFHLDIQFGFSVNLMDLDDNVCLTVDCRALI